MTQQRLAVLCELSGELSVFQQDSAPARRYCVLARTNARLFGAIGINFVIFVHRVY